MNPALVESYRLARAAQDARFDAYARGSACDDTTPEFRAYFGVGEYAGQGVEVRVTFRRWLEGARSAPPVEEPVGWDLDSETAFYLSNDQIADLASHGVPGAIAEEGRRQWRRVEKREEKARRRRGWAA